MEPFGRYQLIRQVAVGGMAEVHLAKTVGVAGFEKLVALKMIHPRLAENDEFVQMLVNEAKIAAQLTHPNIAQTLDLGFVDGRYYIAMEYVDGYDLYNLIRAAAHTGLLLPLDACALIMRDVAAALDHAHCKRDEAGRSLGIVHRDISPDNVLISYEGVVKLVDFGIAKATASSSASAIGTIKGKWLYMSPEQTRGEPLDGRSDIYSAGAVLYEMLTGRTLYEDNGLEPLINNIRAGAFAPPSRLRADLPAQFENILLRALATNREHRYPNADALANDLQAFLQSYSPQFAGATLASLVNVILDRAGVVRAPPPVDPPARVVPTRAATLPGVGSPLLNKQGEPRLPTAATKPDAPPFAEPTLAGVPASDPAPPRKRASRNIIPRVPKPRGPDPEEAEILLVEDPSKQIQIDINEDPSKQIEIEIAADADEPEDEFDDNANTIRQRERR